MSTDAKRPRDDEAAAKKMNKRMRRMSPEELELMGYRKRMEACMQSANVVEALAIFREMQEKDVKMQAYIYQMLLTLCGQAEANILDDAFAVLNHMKERLGATSKKHPVDEPCYSALVRLCAKHHATDRAEALLAEVEAAHVLTKLRTFSPLLLEYASTKRLTDAWRIYETIKSKALDVTEIEFTALLRAAHVESNAAMFYKILAIFMDEILEPSNETQVVLESFFTSNGYTCATGTVDPNGVCSITGAQLQSIELSDEKQAALMAKVEGLVCTNDERTEQWAAFKEWLDANGPFDVLLDAANIGYFSQNFEGGGFKYTQIQRVLQAYQALGKKVLIVLHKRRTKDREVPEALRAMVQSWKDDGVMFNCRPGNNDDWYWLYAAVKLGGRTLVVSNDEMRDHHFSMIANVDFQRWKERHLVHYEKVNGKFSFDEPSVYSKRSQQLTHSWHFPSPNKDTWLVAHKPAQ
ncbi:hypothetical protein SDRG_01457 [Saprolegnia diclina VS20]|uniref:Mitochondrial ribonuclease P catalytic subunit n=1 Tax=Saprolegnia diclina (strain VS20) TaxID=1156394 RepID=T0R565_SAPDV|nr:hypothetical protein SDRG_01457 [Saprolegnia diclina VS20]EQC41490.1 hypothetical protein SDRG_01457 [Saprolegnia diclina VS20]|eukprot:XP_008605204.1 hypothetical protein SDRG_01457 [Saprolegnia diclina VS20]